MSLTIRSLYRWAKSLWSKSDEKFRWAQGRSGRLRGKSNLLTVPGIDYSSSVLQTVK